MLGSKPLGKIVETLAK